MKTHYKMDCLTVPMRLFFIFLLFIATSSGQEMDLACHNINIDDYANMSFCLPQEVSVAPGTVAEDDYSTGGDVSTSMMLNDSNVSMYLLYPCSIKAGLSSAGLRSELNAFDPAMGPAIYNSTPLVISGHEAAMGTVENRTFAVYQTADSVIAAIFFDDKAPYQTMMSLLSSLNIDMGDRQPQRYCAQSIDKLPAIEGIGNYSIKDDFQSDVDNIMTAQDVSQEALMAEQEFAREMYESNGKKGLPKIQA